MDRALLDTDVLSELMRGKHAQVVSRAALYLQEHGRLTFSVLTVLEIVKGLAKAGREARISPFLQFASGHDVLSLDVESAEIAGRLYAGLESQGRPIGRIDPMIAAVALKYRLILVTGNTSHYQRVQDLGFDLSLVDWRQ